MSQRCCPRPSSTYPHDKLPPIELTEDPPPGSKQKLTELGPVGFSRWLRDSPPLKVTDTTFRDAHQSLLATRMRTYDLLQIAPDINGTGVSLLPKPVNARDLRRRLGLTRAA